LHWQLRPGNGTAYANWHWHCLLVLANPQDSPRLTLPACCCCLLPSLLLLPSSSAFFFAFSSSSAFFFASMASADLRALVNQPSAFCTKPLAALTSPAVSAARASLRSLVDSSLVAAAAFLAASSSPGGTASLGLWGEGDRWEQYSSSTTGQAYCQGQGVWTQAPRQLGRGGWSPSVAPMEGLCRHNRLP